MSRHRRQSLKRRRRSSGYEENLERARVERLRERFRAAWPAITEFERKVLRRNCANTELRVAAMLGLDPNDPYKSLKS